MYSRRFAFTTRVSVSNLQLAPARTRHTDEAKVKATDDHKESAFEKKKEEDKELNKQAPR